MIPVEWLRCDKLSIAVATVRVNPDKYKKDFNTAIDKKTPTLSVKLHLSLRPDLQRGRRPVLVVALSKERLS